MVVCALWWKQPNNLSLSIGQVSQWGVNSDDDLFCIHTNRDLHWKIMTPTFLKFCNLQDMMSGVLLYIVFYVFSHSWLTRTVINSHTVVVEFPPTLGLPQRGVGVESRWRQAKILKNQYRSKSYPTWDLSKWLESCVEDIILEEFLSCLFLFSLSNCY